MNRSKMDPQLETESCRGTKILKTPGPFIEEDSGYLSHSQSSMLNDTHSSDLSSSCNGCLKPSVRLSPFHDEGNSTFPSNSMDLSDSCSIVSGFLAQNSNVFLAPVDLVSGVPQSTPATERLCVNMLKEFNFVTPLPGSSSNTSSQRICLAGRKHVDILSLLSVTQVPPLDQILSYLEPDDLCQLRLVSSSWNKLLHESRQRELWQNFVRHKHQNKENSQSDFARREELLVTPVLTRSLLRDINNVRIPGMVQVSEKPLSPPVSPSKLRHTLYYKEGQKLENGEKLRKCPKCDWPSRVESCQSGVRCTSPNCRFHFCMDCSGPFHTTPCARVSPVTPTKARNRENRLYKKRLRRLLY